MTDGKATRAGAMAGARSYVESGTFEADLARRVAFKTESQMLPASLPELQRYLDEEMAPAFAQLGFTTRIYPNPLPGQGPVLLATLHRGASLPTVLGYGHGDVIRGLEDQWTKGKGPGSRRATATGSTAAAPPTTRASTPSTWPRSTRCGQSAAAQLGFNAKFIIEMGEEAGSKGWPSWSPPTRRTSPPMCWSPPTARA